MKLGRFIRTLGMGACVAAMAGMAALAMGQDTSASSTYNNGAARVTTDVTRARVVYVSGKDVVVKLVDGTVKHVIVPDDVTANVNGKELHSYELKPGMVLTRTITTTVQPELVRTVRTIHGKVWFINPPSSVILTLADGTNKQYKVPDGQKFSINGQMKDIFALRKGMTVSATAITESTLDVASSTRTVNGVAPPPPPPATPPPTPPAMAVLLIEDPTPAPQPTAAEAAPVQQARATLPKTASNLPFLGLLGMMLLGGGLVLRRVRG